MGNKKPYLIALLVQLIYTGLYVISKAAFNEGLSTFVFIFYRQAAATILLLPIAIIYERKNASTVTLMVLFKMFMLSLLGITFSLEMYNVGLKYTSATVGSATSNSIPVITFFLALTLRMEMLNMKKLSGIAKILGVALCFSGVMAIAFYSGPHLNPLIHHQLFRHKISPHDHISTQSSKSTWVIGTFLLIAANTAWALWIVLQGFLLREYSSKLLLTTLQCLFSTVQSFCIALAFERDVSRWYLSWNMGLLSIAYCGFIVTGVTFYLQTWIIEKKGPVFLAMSTPLASVFTIFCSSIFLGEIISLGSVLGVIMMVGGLYCVLWGKSKEQLECAPTTEDGKEFHERKEFYEETEITSLYPPL